MSSPTPLQSLLGGIGLALPVHVLLLLNGNVFGISGFMHHSVRGGKESAAAIAGLILGGAYIGLLERTGPSPFVISPTRIVLGGLLVGLGSKLSNGCTSGHMICGLSRFSIRSIVATVTFCITAVLTVQALPAQLPSTKAMDWSLGPYGRTILATHAVLSTLLCSWVTTSRPPLINDDANPSKSNSQSIFRQIAFLSTGFQFALALRLSNLSENTRILSFLSLPFRSTFDPSLAFLAAGAVPTSATLYQFFRGSEKPLLGGPWSIPKGDPIDSRLVAGAAIFGVGWGLAGVCPGPSLVNLGRALCSCSGFVPVATWIAAFVVGGLFA